jgi:hypothetical protein
MNIEVKTDAKAYASGSIEINASIEKVFSLLANIKDWPAWFDGVTEVDMSGNIEEGAEFTWIAQGYKIKSKIHTYIRNSELGWTGNMWWIKAVHNWRFEKLTDDKTKVVIQECFTGFLSSFMKDMLMTGVRSDLNMLKKQCEKS